MRYTVTTKDDKADIQTQLFRPLQVIVDDSKGRITLDDKLEIIGVAIITIHADQEEMLALLSDFVVESEGVVFTSQKE